VPFFAGSGGGDFALALASGPVVPADALLAGRCVLSCWVLAPAASSAPASLPPPCGFTVLSGGSGPPASRARLAAMSGGNVLKSVIKFLPGSPPGVLFAVLAGVTLPGAFEAAATGGVTS